MEKHTHTQASAHTRQDICTLCAFLQLAFTCRLCEKFSPDSSYKPFFQVNGIAIFLHDFTRCVCLALLEIVYACMHACTTLLMKYLATLLLHNAIMCLRTQHCLQTSCFPLTSLPLTFKSQDNFSSFFYVYDPASQVQR